MAFVVIYIASTLATFFSASYLFDGVMKNPLFWILIILVFGGIMYIPIGIKAKKYGYAFAASSVMIAGMIGLAALSLFPRLVPSSIDLNYSLTIYNASSSQNTLTTMLIIALLGMPVVVAYTIFIYRVFKGKVIINHDSY
jgi:cytochrome d ubiquinol oxidase subunit II